MSEQAKPQAAPAQAPAFSVDTSQISTVYANFCHVTSLPEELILDFGLNTQMTPAGNQPIRLSHRLVLNYFTAKRLLQGLHMAVSRFEQNFGNLEMDVQKRVRPVQSGPGGKS